MLDRTAVRVRRCAQWWDHGEAIARLTVLWNGWQSAWWKPAAKPGWWLDLDHHLPLLIGLDGPLRTCRHRKATGWANTNRPSSALVHSRLLAGLVHSSTTSRLSNHRRTRTLPNVADYLTLLTATTARLTGDTDPDGGEAQHALLLAEYAGVAQGRAGDTNGRFTTATPSRMDSVRAAA
jgi:hypothetical protein